MLLENERVRLIETQVPAGSTTPVHTHRWASVEYVLSTTDFIRRDGDGNVMLDTRIANGRPEPLGGPVVAAATAALARECG